MKQRTRSISDAAQVSRIMVAVAASAFCLRRRSLDKEARG